MKAFLIALICLAVVGELALAARSSLHEWTQFKRRHGKSYESQAEDARRYANFMATKETIERHNAQANSSYKMGLNHMADWTQEEKDMLLGTTFGANVSRIETANSAEDVAYLAKILASSNEPAAYYFDWRDVPNRVTDVKFQLSCASSWAFSAAGALEGQLVPRGVNMTGDMSLSVQELVDCSKSNQGCNGGQIAGAYDDLKSLGGIVTDKEYPYEAEEGKCNMKGKKIVTTVAGHIQLPENDETALQEALVKFGPISITMAASGNLLLYENGVFEDDDCAIEPNLSVLLVGYGHHDKLGDYWSVKNSWGPDWGINGYFYIRRGVGMCRMGKLSVIPKF